jgi:AP2 domain
VKDGVAAKRYPSQKRSLFFQPDGGRRGVPREFCTCNRSARSSSEMKLFKLSNTQLKGEMKSIPLTKGFSALVDDSDYEMLTQYRWRAKTDRKKRAVYAVTGKSAVRMHRLLLSVTDSRIQVDHKDRDGLNNQRYNLRVCSNSQNQTNKSKIAGKFTSRFKGVHWDKKLSRWKVGLVRNQKKVHIGLYTDEIEAALAYDEAARHHFGEFACCNFPPKKPCAVCAPALEFLMEECFS